MDGAATSYLPSAVQVRTMGLCLGRFDHDACFCWQRKQRAKWGPSANGPDGDSDGSDFVRRLLASRESSPARPVEKSDLLRPQRLDHKKSPKPVWFRALGMGDTELESVTSTMSKFPGNPVFGGFFSVFSSA